MSLSVRFLNGPDWPISVATKRSASETLQPPSVAKSAAARSTKSVLKALGAVRSLALRLRLASLRLTKSVLEVFDTASLGRW